MKERPILFSAPMVRAILEGRKTQTRRVVKPQPIYVCSKGPDDAPVLSSQTNWASDAVIRCPYGAPGDRLWVREAFRFTDVFDQDSPSRVGERCVDAGYRTPWAPLQFEADGRRLNWEHTSAPPHDEAPRPGKLRPGMFMPRWASRILLKVTAVRVERLQAISRGDAMAEGCPFPNMAQGADPREWYGRLWEQINGSESWDANPWVWVVEFRRVEA